MIKAPPPPGSLIVSRKSLEENYFMQVVPGNPKRRCCPGGFERAGWSPAEVDESKALVPFKARATHAANRGGLPPQGAPCGLSGSPSDALRAAPGTCRALGRLSHCR